MDRVSPQLLGDTKVSDDTIVQLFRPSISDVITLLPVRNSNLLLLNGTRQRGPE